MRLIKILAPVIGVVLFATPLALSAQATPVQSQIDALLKLIAQLQAQIAVLRTQQTSPSGINSAPICFSFTRDLSIGSKDAGTNGEVSRLQQFLTGEGVYPEALVTGYFGSATSRALQRWQTANGILISTSAGSLGPKTRSLIQQKCGYTPTAPSVQPIIVSFNGPTTLDVNEMGTWTAHVIAPNPSNGAMRYVVRWGDEPSPQDVVLPANWPGLGFASEYSAPTFTHAYNQAGTYTLAFSAFDSNVTNVTGKNLTVEVGGTQGDWKVYYSSEFGVSFSHPAPWQCKTNKTNLYHPDWHQTTCYSEGLWDGDPLVAISVPHVAEVYDLWKKVRSSTLSGHNAVSINKSVYSSMAVEGIGMVEYTFVGNAVAKSYSMSALYGPHKPYLNAEEAEGKLDVIVRDFLAK